LVDEDEEKIVNQEKFTTIYNFFEYMQIIQITNCKSGLAIVIVTAFFFFFVVVIVIVAV
jgi:hypothetical protein